MQALEALPDSEFSLGPLEAGEGTPGAEGHASLVSTKEACLALQPCLKVKWLRSDCFKVLDVSDIPSEQWTETAWRHLVMCLSAVQDLEVLRVKLPDYPGGIHGSYGCNDYSYLNPGSIRKRFVPCGTIDASYLSLSTVVATATFASGSSSVVPSKASPGG